MSRCPQGCDLNISDDNIEQHLRYDCNSRHVMCEFCFKSYVVNRREEHVAQCSMFPISCPYGCGLEGVARNQMKLHVQDCCLKQEHCRYVHLGCEYTGRGLDLASHEDDVPFHFEMVAHLYMNLHLRFDVFYHSTRALILELQNQYLILKNALDDNTKHLRRLQVFKRRVEDGPALNGLCNLKCKSDISNTNSDKVTEELKRQISVLTSRVKALEEPDAAAVTDETNEGVDSQRNFEERYDLPVDDHFIDRPRHKENHSGVLLWRIRRYSQLKGNAAYSSGRPCSMFSRAFHSSRYGYRMCGKIYVNGNNDGEGTHISIYIVIMKGPHDSFLPWPFPHRVKVMLMARTGDKLLDYTGTIRPISHQEAFQRPISATNPEVGFSKFVSHSVLEHSDTYLHNDSFCIKIIVGDPATNEV